jgi:hypothetical protein
MPRPADGNAPDTQERRLPDAVERRGPVPSVCFHAVAPMRAGRLPDSPEYYIFVLESDGGETASRRHSDAV